MARDESPKEDLLADARQLVERIRFVPHVGRSDVGRDSLEGVSIVAGFRADGAFSIFFGEDPAYHFNADGELRRAYHDGLLVKAVDGRLVSLRRERTETETQLLRHEFSAKEQEDFVLAMKRRLEQLFALLAAGDFDVKGQVPPERSVLARVKRWLWDRESWPIAARPNV